MATNFTQVANNAKTHADSGDLNNTTDPVTFSVTTGEGALFPSPGNGFYLTVWDDTNYNRPGDDSGMEIVLCTARSSDSFTCTRAQLGTSVVAHAGSPAVELLIVDQLVEDLQDAVNTLEGFSHFTPKTLATDLYSAVGSDDVDWTDVDVTSDTSSTVTAVLLRTWMKDSNVSATTAHQIRKKGHTANSRTWYTYAQTSNVFSTTDTMVEVDEDGIFQYKIDASGVGSASYGARLKGYWSTSN